VTNWGVWESFSERWPRKLCSETFSNGYENHKRQKTF